MEVGLTALAAQLFLLFIISKLVIYIDLRYCRNNTDDYVAVDVFLGKKILLYSMNVPIIELVKNGHLFWLESELNTTDGKVKTHIKQERRFMRNALSIYLRHPIRFWRLLKSVKYYAKLYRQFVCKLVSQLKCEYLKWDTKFGAEDAAATGIITGGVWLFKGMLVTVLKRRFQFTAPPSLTVSPLFGKACFEVYFRCIFSLKIGKIINATTMLVNLSGKGAVTSGRPSNPRAHENGNGKYKRHG